MPDQLSRNLLHSTASGQEYPQELSECQRKFSELLVEYDFLSLVLESMNVLVIVLDSHGRIIRYNCACERLFGYTAKEVGAKLGTGLLPLPEGVQVIKTLLAFLRKTGDERHFENEWVDSSGKPRTITWTISILTKNKKSVEYVFAAGLDITSRKVAEKTLERERALLNGLLNSIPDLVFYKDKNGTYTGCNVAFELFSKIKGVDIIGKTDVDLYGLDLGLQFLKTDRLALHINQSINFENWFRGEDGLPVLIETRKNPYYDPEGNMLGIIGIGRDITKHRNSEDALRKAKHEIEQMISSLSSILIALSPEMFITKLNPSAQNILGINPSEAIGKRLEDAGIPLEWPIISKHLNRCRQNLSSEFLDPVPFKRRDSLSGFLGININPILDEAKNLSGIIILAGDITERKILEERYTQSQRLGSIGRLASGISHEINTPIQYVGNNIDFLQTSFESLKIFLEFFEAFYTKVICGQLSPEDIADMDAVLQTVDLTYLYKEIPLAIQQSQEGIKRVADIIRGMREFSHPGFKCKTPLDLNQVLEKTLTVTKNEWKYIAHIETRFDPVLPLVPCLPGEISQVFLNLIINAAHAIAAKGKKDTESEVITVETQFCSGWVEVRISDTGIGIPTEIQQHIFELFFTTKEVGKGTGQGLTIAYDVVVYKHNGTITFNSVPGQGTVFIVRLPCVPSEQKPSN